MPCLAPGQLRTMLSAPCLELPFVITRKQNFGIRRQQAERYWLIPHVDVDHFRQHACHCILDIEYHYMTVCMVKTWAVRRHGPRMMHASCMVSPWSSMARTSLTIRSSYDEPVVGAEGCEADIAVGALQGRHNGSIMRAQELNLCRETVADEQIPLWREAHALPSDRVRGIKVRAEAAMALGKGWPRLASGALEG